MPKPPVLDEDDLPDGIKGKTHPQDGPVEREKLTVDVVYYDKSRRIFGVTPDCWGFFWFDTLDEVIEAYGEVEANTVVFVDEILDF